MPEFYREARELSHVAAAMRERLQQLDVTFEGMDAISGLQNGYAAKLLSALPSKNLGPGTLGVVLGALGLKLAVVEDPDVMAKIGPRLPKRERPWPGVEPIVPSSPEIETIVQQRLRKIMSDRARRGGLAAQRKRRKQMKKLAAPMRAE